MSSKTAASKTVASESAGSKAATELVVACPACRAKQSLQDTCRRCGADLKLLAQIKRRIHWLVNQRASAVAAGRSEDATQYSRELALLSSGHQSQ